MALKPTEQDIIKDVNHWIENFVIKHHLCPFAVKPFKNKQVKLVYINSKEDADIFDCLEQEINILNNTDIHLIETTIIIVPHQYHDFHFYLQEVARMEKKIIAKKWGGKFQLATFHPEYVFADHAINDVENFTNRSPYPLIHILRESSITQSLKNTKITAADIVKHNITKMREIYLSQSKKF